MAKLISTDIDHRMDYRFDAKSDMWIPISSVTCAEDVIFNDGENLEKKIEYLKDYGTDVKTRVASAVSRSITFTSSEATWDTIFTNIKNASSYLVVSKTWGYTGDTQTYTVPVTGTYQIECVGAGQKYSKGARVWGNITLYSGSILYINVGGQFSTFNGGGKGGSVWHSASNMMGSFNRNITSTNGCGASDIRLDGINLEDRIIVAGGGGGNGNYGGVNFSWNGEEESGGSYDGSISGYNTVSSNNVLGQGSPYSTWVVEDIWGPCDGYEELCSCRYVRGGGGGGYYGGKSGYAGTSYTSSDFPSNSVFSNPCEHEGHGYVRLTLL